MKNFLKKPSNEATMSDTLLLTLGTVLVSSLVPQMIQGVGGLFQRVRRNYNACNEET